jgi:hypothetical protein
MSQVPSIKATGFQSAADDLMKLIDAGRLPREELEARLQPGDFRYLEKQLAASTWVPIDIYRRIVEVLVELEAQGSAEEYLHQRGVRAAQRLHKAGLYRQFEASPETWGRRVGKIATTMAAVLYNFTRWSFETGEDRGTFQIFVDEAQHFPEVARYTTQGFVEYVSCTLAGRSDHRVTSTRPTPDRVIYRGGAPKAR